ncbi:MAG: DUF262 domain-containing protein [Firmicutes bacterium]|nr:DUF262 domain-containing protein [Bacillota bacterium]
MQASNRSIQDWYGKIQRGEIRLPRFQRLEAWDSGRIKSMMNMVIHNLPLGITLVLEVGEKEPFVSRYISTAPQAGGKVYEHLLDGQQRLTAMWRVLHNNYERHTYFVYIPEFDESAGNDSEELSVFCETRFFKSSGRRYPLWCDDPTATLKRGLIPMQLLRPEDIQEEIDEWLNQATANRKPKLDVEELEAFFDWKKSISDTIRDLRSILRNYNLPYLALPSFTSKSVALEVFINMNTNSKPLTTYDIIVAEVESELGESLRVKQEQLTNTYPGISRYDDLPRLILNTSALLQDRMPNQRGAWQMDKKLMVAQWDVMAAGLDRMTGLLESEGIFDDARLPTNAVLWVIAALYRFVPEFGDRRGWCERILKQYMWRAFLTGRYENSAATHAYRDYQGLKRILGGQSQDHELSSIGESVPIFNEAAYELPSAEELVDAPWPKLASIDGRAVLAITTRLGAFDFATEERVTASNISERHYHHIFPESLLSEAGLEDKSSIAMNCALIGEKTNLNIGRKEPLEYLRERFKWAKEETIKYRLSSHLIPMDELANGGYEGLEAKERAEKIDRDYNAFIQRRARLFEVAVRKLCNGSVLDAKDVFREAIILSSR